MNDVKIVQVYLYMSNNNNDEKTTLTHSLTKCMRNNKINALTD